MRASNKAEPNGPDWGEPLARSTVMGFESEFAQNETRSTEREINRLLSEGRSNMEKTENFFTSNWPTLNENINSVDQESSSSRATEGETNMRPSEGRSEKEESENLLTSDQSKPKENKNSVEQESYSAEKNEEKIWRRAQAMEGDNFMNLKDWMLDLMVDEELLARTGGPREIKGVFEKIIKIGTPYIKEGVESAMIQQSIIMIEKERTMGRSLKILQEEKRFLKRERDEMELHKENIIQVLEMKEIEVREAKMEAQKLREILTESPSARTQSPTAHVRTSGLDKKTKPFADPNWLTSEGCENHGGMSECSEVETQDFGIWKARTGHSEPGFENIDGGNKSGWHSKEGSPEIMTNERGRIDLLSSTANLKSAEAENMAIKRFAVRMEIVQDFLQDRAAIMQSLDMLKDRTRVHPGTVRHMIEADNKDIESLERADKLKTMMHKQLKQLEDDMMSRLDPALKNRQGEKTSSMDEMPSFTKTVIEGEPINILKHAARYMRKQMATRYLPYIVVLYMIESYSGEENICSSPPVNKSDGYNLLKSAITREVYDQQNHLMWDDMDAALQDMPTLMTQTKQVVKYGNKDTLSTEAIYGDGCMRLFSLMCLKSKPTIPHKADIKRHLEHVMYSLMMKHNPKDVCVWAAEWIEKGLRMGQSRPMVDFTLSIGNTAHGLMRRTLSVSFWMQKWVAPKKNEYAEDALVVIKDFMSDVMSAVKSLEQQPNFDERSWEATQESVIFQHKADEEAFIKVSRALAANRVGEWKNNGGQGNRNERNIRDEMGKPTRPGAKLCDAINCPGIEKFGRAFEIYPEMVKKNPDIVLCVRCYVDMLREGKDVVTKQNGVIKFRKPAPRGASKAKMTQVHKGKGAKVLVQHYEYAQSEDAPQKHARVIQQCLRDCPTSFYKPNENNAKEDETTDRNQNDLQERVEKLESASMAAKKSWGISEEDAGQRDKTTKQKEDDEHEKATRASMIEEWFRLKGMTKPSGRSNNEQDDMDDFNEMLKAMNARKQNKHI